MFKIRFSLNKLSTFLLNLSILIFIIGFNFSDNRSSGWYQQFLPNIIGNAQITDITFSDSLTGYAVTGTDSSGNSYILKTISGGDNWSVVRTETGNRGLTHVKFLNKDTGYVTTKYTLSGKASFYRTINGGISWDTINKPHADYIVQDLTVLSIDTIWVTYYSAFDGGLYRTTNGGSNWEIKFFNIIDNPESIYMFNSNFGFMFYHGSLYRTTNAGVNWETNSGGAFSDIQFIDSLTGWKANGNIKKTSDGGLSWTEQQITPKSKNIFFSRINNFSIVNRDTLWGFGRSEYYFPGSGVRGFIHKTTNGGLNWGYQIPLDTSIYITQYDIGQFVNTKKGWTYTFNTGAHTKSGGNDTTIYVGIYEIENLVPNNSILNQNFPNPFNPVTIINYELRTSNFIKLKVYDILGNEIETLVNQKQNSGSYKVEFDGNSLPSGVYFYSLFADGVRIDTKKMVLVR